MLKSRYRRERGVEEAAWQGEGTATDVRLGLRCGWSLWNAALLKVSRLWTIPDCAPCSGWKELRNPKE